jgi:hypothetical protein
VQTKIPRSTTEEKAIGKRELASNPIRNILHFDRRRKKMKRHVALEENTSSQLHVCSRILNRHNKMKRPLVKSLISSSP